MELRAPFVLFLTPHFDVPALSSWDTNDAYLLSCSEELLFTDFAMTYARNGDLLQCLQRLGSFDDEAGVFLHF